MENLRRIIIPWAFDGYNFTFESSDSSSSYIVTITSVVKNSSADSAGLRTGDGIVSINGNLLRGLTEKDIQLLIESYGHSTLELTVLQNFTNKYSRNNVNNAAKQSTFISKTSTQMRPITFPSKNYNTNSQGIKRTVKPKYSRNMSDVTDNSKFYCLSLTQSHSRNSSPHKDPDTNKSSTLPNCKDKLQLNRVGGLVGSSPPTGTSTNNIFTSKGHNPDIKRQSKLTYFTCPPTPYKSGRVVSAIETQETTPLRKQLALNNFNNRSSEPTPKTTNESFESNLEEESVADEVEEEIESLMHINPVPVKIMWKYINNEEVDSPSMQPCYIAVEDGIFKVQEREDNDKCTSDTEQASPVSTSASLKSKFIYNFSYYDSDQRKWEFLVEFADQNASIKWMHFFDTPNQNQGRKYSRPSISEIVTPVGYIQTEATAVHPSAKYESSNKGKLHSAFNRVRNFTQRRITHNEPSTEFRRQQEEWIQKTEPQSLIVPEGEGDKDGSTSPCNDHYKCHNKVHMAQLTTLSLDKWQRSVTSPLIPLVVEICVKVIEKYGLHYTGIYRVSGNKLTLDALNAELRKPISNINVSSEAWTDVYAISGVLKSFLRNLPDGVFPKEYYFDIISAWKMYDKDREKRLLSVQRLLNILESFPDHPEYRHHRETLKYLASHLFLVASKNSVNKMTVKNLAVVFAPTLIRPPIETNELLMSDYRYRIELVESIINHYEWMFSPTFESACNIPHEVEEESYAVRDMPLVSVTVDEIAENKDKESKEDARILVKEIIDTVRRLSPGSAKKESMDVNQYTLIELNTNKESAKRSDSPDMVNLHSTKKISDDDSHSGSECAANTHNKDKKSGKRSSFKIRDKLLPKSKTPKSNFPREQLLLTNKKLCALSVALISSNHHPLRSAVISNDDILMKLSDE